MKKFKNIFKIFLALALIFSQLSNATLVFAEEITGDGSSENGTQEVEDPTATYNEEEDKEQPPFLGDGENEGQEEGEEETPDTPENPEVTEEKTDFTLEDLELLMNAYINSEELPEELINLLIAKGAPSVQNGQLNGLTLEDIMFVSELLKENADTDTEREENEYLKLELGEVPEEVTKGDTFDVDVVVSNEILEELTDEEGNLIVSEDFIDGVEGLITTSDNLKVTNVAFSNFTGVNNEEGMFVATGNEYGEDKGVLFTVTFEAVEEGEGEVTISGNVAKYLTISAFDDLTFTVMVNPFEEASVGLGSLTSDVGEFDKEFDTDTTEYTLTVPAGTTKITLSGSLLNELDDVIGLSTYTIDNDNMTITIVVTDADCNEKVYTINVVRLASEENTDNSAEEVASETVEEPVAVPVVYYVYSSNNYLKTLDIKNYDINFEKGVLEYKLKVGADVRFLDITAVAEDYRSRVEISGNEEFKEGENVVTIKVTAEDGSTREYKVLVDKAKEKDNKTTTEDEENSGKTEKIVIIVLIILVVLGLLYLIFKKDDEENNAKVENNNNTKKNKER